MTDNNFKINITSEKGVNIQPNMYGLFFEDINYAADGGIYAEMIENRSFEQIMHNDCDGGTKETYRSPGYAWSAVDGVMHYKTENGLNEINPHYLEFSGRKFKNKAYEGMYVEAGKSYKVSFYAKADTYNGTVSASAVNNGIVAFSGIIAENVTGEWKKYESILTAEVSIRYGDFVISLEDVGTVCFDMISVIPCDAVCGVFRRDLAEMLKEMKPGFLRFPGGCVIEGWDIENRYQWKHTVGPAQERTQNWNRWAVSKRPKYLDYNQTYGLGFYEYFLLCELLDAKPLPVLNIGTACQFRSTEMVDSDNPKFEEYVQDALDLIEFANGPVDSTWGALRARMGHPESFHMDFLSVGNEQWETQYLDMKHRYERFAQAIHAKYPEIRLLGTAGPFMECSITEDAWEFYREKAKENPDFSYAVDEHYYVSPQWLYDHVAMYDEYPRNVAVFAGEYAAHTEDRANSMESALAEAALLTGIEKNADVVKLASYAPLFNRIGHSQWKPDMIWFDDSDVYLTPNYYVQKLFANHRGTYTIPLQKQDVKLRKEGIYVSAAVDAQGEIILKLVNTNHREYALMLEDADGLAVRTTGQMWTLRGTGEMPEDRPEVSAVTEETAEIDGCVFIPAQSLVVIRYQ